MILVLILVYLVASGESSIHVYIMGFLSLGLMASLNWRVGIPLFVRPPFQFDPSPIHRYLLA